MSAYATTDNNNGSPFLRMLFLLIVAGVLVALAVTALGVTTTPHAEKHPEANEIRNCLDNNGPFMVMKHLADPTFFLICQLNDGRFGIQPVTEDGFEKTAFVKFEGTWNQTMNYLGKFATRFTGKLPWLP